MAIPRKLKKPTTSVTVVRMIDDDWAGSCRSAVRTIGIAAPARPAATIDRTIERPITRVSPGERLHKKTAAAVETATARPFEERDPGLLARHPSHWRTRTSRRKRPRMVTANACAPVFPDCPATTGKRTARAVKRAMVPSNNPTTEAARKAVRRLTSSHGSRLRTAKPTGERARSSLLAPTMRLDIGGGRLLDGLQEGAVGDDTPPDVRRSPRPAMPESGGFRTTP